MGRARRIHVGVQVAVCVYTCAYLCTCACMCLLLCVFSRVCAYLQCVCTHVHMCMEGVTLATLLPIEGRVLHRPSCVNASWAGYSRQEGMLGG